MSTAVVDADLQLELQHLLSGLCDGELSDAEHDRLEELLAANPRCRRMYVQYMELHSALVLAGRDNVLLPYSSRDDFTCDIGSPEIIVAGDVRPSELAGPTAPAPAPAPNRATVAYQYFLVAAATLAASILVQVFWWRPAETSLANAPGIAKVEPQLPKNAEASKYVATLRDAVDCVWEKPAPELKVGTRLLPGELHLPKGVAFVQFDSGPEIVVEGPAEIRLDSSTAATVLSGKVVLRADESSAPFDLHTPTSTLAEIGTEFAVVVNRDMEEVHVFEGEVQRTPKTETVGAKAESLKAGDARHYDRNAKFSGKPTPCDPKKFVRKFASAPARGDLPPGLLAYDGFDYRSANALFSGKANGGFGWVGSWKAGFTRPADNETFRFSLNVREGLARRDSSKSAVGGSFDYAGFAAASRRLAKPVRMDTGGTTYISFLVRRSGPPSDPINSAGILFWTHDDFTAQKFENARQRLFVGIKKDNRLSARLQKMDAFAPISVNNQETLLIVAKIASKRTGADQVFLRAYAANDVVDAAEPATWTVSSGPFQCDLTFDWLQVYINSKTRQTLDEIRLGTTWPSVTAAYLNRQRI